MSLITSWAILKGMLAKQAKDFTLEEHQALIDQYKQLYREHHQTFPKALKNNSMLLS